jgi:hypothetical protein
VIAGTLRTGLTKILVFHKIEQAQNLASTKLSGPFAIKVTVAAMQMAKQKMCARR